MELVKGERQAGVEDQAGGPVVVSQEDFWGGRWLAYGELHASGDAR